MSVSVVSALVVAAAVLYAVSPAVETLAARVISGHATRAGKERIEGRALESGKPVTRVFVTVYRVVDGRRKLVGSTEVNAQGRFSLNLPPGSYVVVVRHSGKSVTLAVVLRRRSTIFIAIVLKSGGGFLGVPVIFNY